MILYVPRPGHGENFSKDYKPTRFPRQEARSVISSAMNFQPIDYLSNINLDLGSTYSPEEPVVNNNDLDVFSQADFFDLDVFSHGFAAPTKSQQQIAVKLEDQEAMVQMNQSLMMSPQLGSPAREEGLKHNELNEVKRKRNTAASARFRIKKKLKEKQMEEQTRELQEKLSTLEKKLKTLEMENKCLKKLILEKNERKNCELLETIKKRSLGSSGLGGDDSSSFIFTN